ncbi:type II toxin-antitoxin system RelE/ParE family toxin [Massilia antarctica]|uniref:Type II toxin-antitoxin system RelE/ParE family toxin n=1 Tax=Massilia antarctica TaxID=2765360 RepID=A0AA48W996_9BURK|nr:type II toxin-antitoxin system RelE/ParE family toxin [Massilia antarctica]QPI48341.1 type II toxin-antitoxin system RelE/ParE family toxin [Massilia antarctica]
MPQVRFSKRAVLDLKRLREFLRPKSQAAARRANAAIIRSIQVLSRHPGFGRPLQHMPDGYYEFLISFGNAGYIVRYRHKNNEMVIWLVRHQKDTPQ